MIGMHFPLAMEALALSPESLMGMAALCIGDLRYLCVGEAPPLTVQAGASSTIDPETPCYSRMDGRRYRSRLDVDA